MFSNFIRSCQIKSDINEHLPTLFEYTKQCTSVVECGVRNIVSSYAFASGLLSKPNNRYYLVDPYKAPMIDKFVQQCRRHKINAMFFHGSDLKCPLVPTDLLFIDTWHVYGQLKRELAYWHKAVAKYIIMHDTTVDDLEGEAIRTGCNIEASSKATGIPGNEITKGLWPAIEEFLADHPEWVLHERFTNNNGLTILKRKDVE